MKIIEIENSHHMGDQIINFIFFTQITSYLEANNIFIKYYCWGTYHNNLNDFNPSSNISIHPLSEPYIKKYYELWQGGEISTLTRHITYVEDVLVFMFNYFLKIHNMNLNVNRFGYETIKIKEWYTSLDNRYNNINILVINSTPRSGQYNYNKDVWNNQLIQLSKKYKLATTEPVHNSILSLETLPLKDICAISTKVDYIIAINTGPLIPLFNTDTLNNVKKIFIFGGKFNTDKCICNPPDLLSCFL